MDDLPFPEFASTLPVADRRSLFGLPNSEMRSWTVSRAEEYRKFALTLLAIHNHIPPIHCLPNELLSHIFAHSWYNRDSFRIAHVCRRWRQVILTTARFWVDAVEGESFRANVPRCPCDPPAYIATILRRSTPLHIQPEFVCFSETSWRSLQSNLSRITVLTVHVESIDQVAWLHRTLEQSMQALEKLVVRYQPEVCACERRDCFDHYLDNRLDVEPL